MEWRIFPLDVLFFRGTEPMNAGETDVVQSLFPPSPQVLQGFVRTALLEALEVPFTDYAQATNGKTATEKAKRAVQLLGLPGETDFGQLDIRGPYLIQEQDGQLERFYPAPLDLIERDGFWTSQELDDKPIQTDLSLIRCVPEPGESDRHWITGDGLKMYLEGKRIPLNHIVPEHKLIQHEPRVRITRSTKTHVAEDHLLFATDFVRLSRRTDTHLSSERVGIGVLVDGIDNGLQKSCAGIRRLGGEGYLAELIVEEEHEFLPSVSVTDSPSMRMVVLSPVRWQGKWCPPDANQNDTGWSASLNGTQVNIEGAVVGKPIWIGGWDIVNRGPKPAEACVPAGSVYFISGSNLKALHGQKVGAGSQMGFGQIAIGQ
jgi:CRISPR-associated protein Cmr3